ncbi:potassium-transporting ATPase subunit KdpA [Acidicapsa acidisoli]|uniref:potassium-transporting ATPase subunit KdpA n=1 Tax=Acidicapsa acidisoli TaxID=1615681 RepID=UPI0021DF566E|nr:potassium-transporting ATPase subunit KdpA [Acidicapsa acidisoli]
MNFFSVVQYLLFVVIVTACVKPLGGYMYRVFSRERTFPDRLCIPIERWIYQLTGVDPSIEMDARQYAICFVVFSLICTLFLYAILRYQRFLPWFFPDYQTTPLSPDLSFNTAISFSTTTTWQAYAGESTMSYFSQMAGLCTQNFLAGAAGLAVGIAFLRGLARESRATLGNFWVDLTRSLLWILLPGAFLGSLVLVWQGVPMNFHHYEIATTLEGRQQIIPQGPVAALELIKNLGTNGGGFFNANGAHPYENPTPLTNFLELLSIILLPAALTNTFGRMVRHLRQGWLIYWVMLLLFTGGLIALHLSEQSASPLIHGIDSRSSQHPSCGNMEGKEVRFGLGGTVLAGTVTSNGATGSSNAADDSFSSLGGLVLLVNLLLGEVIFGGLGTGLLGMIMTAAIAVFLAGLMIGRTPEYLGKQIGPSENKMIVLYALSGPVTILILTAIAISTNAGLAGLATNSGPHGLTEIFFAFASCFGNNGQTFGGLSANTPFYNIMTAIAMMAGRFGLAVPALIFAGLFAQQPARARSRGTLPTDSLPFGILLTVFILIFTALSYFPALTLGPVLEHFLFKI